MIKLLRAGVRRNTHSLVFWLALAAACVTPLYIVLNNYYYANMLGQAFPPDYALLGSINGYIFPLALAVFVSVFLGTEYLDKTIRNKLIVGHSRTALYFSNLILCIMAAAAMYGAALAVAVSVGVPLLGRYEMNAEVVLPQIGCYLLAAAALASVYTMLVMLIDRIVAAGLSTVLLGTALAYLPRVLWERVYISVEDLRTGPVYRICKVLYDILPTCQIYRCTPQAERMPENLWVFPVYSILIIAAATVVGVYFFKRKNLN